MPNKVKFGLENVHYAEVTISSDGSVTYGTPVPIKGAVSFAVSPNITRTAIPADNNEEYYVTFEDNGYTGDIEFLNLDDDARAVMFGSTVENGVLIESKDDEPNPVALLFEFSGDKHKTRHVLYNCLCTKPNVESETGKKNVKNDKVSLSARPAEDTGRIKAKVPNTTTTAEIYNSWYDEVYTGTAAQSGQTE